jgi:hypothetical protein
VTSCDGVNILMDLNPGETSQNYCVTDNSWVLDADITIQIIGGCLNDGDITVTPPPTPTPSPTPSPSYNTVYISNGGFSTSALACGTVTSLAVYYAGTLGNNTVLYTDTSLTTPYNGAKLWHSIGSNNVGRIGNTGIISSYGFCAIGTL